MVATFQATKLLERVVFWYDTEVRFTSRNHVNMRVPVSSKRILESGMKRSLLVFPEPPDTLEVPTSQDRVINHLTQFRLPDDLQNSGGFLVPVVGIAMSQGVVIVSIPNPNVVNSSR